MPTVVWAFYSHVLASASQEPSDSHLGLDQPCLVQAQLPHSAAPGEGAGSGSADTAQGPPGFPGKPQELLDPSHLHAEPGNSSSSTRARSPHANQHQPHECGIKMPYDVFSGNERKSDGCRIQMRAGHPRLLFPGGRTEKLYLHYTRCALTVNIVKLLHTCDEIST